MCVHSQILERLEGVVQDARLYRTVNFSSHNLCAPASSIKCFRWDDINGTFMRLCLVPHSAGSTSGGSTSRTCQ